MAKNYNILTARFSDGQQGTASNVRVRLFGFRNLCRAFCYGLPYSLICC